MTNDARIKISKEFNDLNSETDIFLPKVRKLRSDGASLSEVYRSKKEDVWGKILHQQLIEEEQKNYEKQRHKEQLDALYGAKLKEQIVNKQHIDASQQHSGDFMVNATGGTVRINYYYFIHLYVSFFRYSFVNCFLFFLFQFFSLKWEQFEARNRERETLRALKHTEVNISIYYYYHYYYYSFHFSLRKNIVCK